MFIRLADAEMVVWSARRHPWPVTVSMIRECEPMDVSSMINDFPINVNGSTLTREPRLVFGMMQQLGPISQSLPMITGPDIIVLGPMMVPFPIPTGPWICLLYTSDAA